MVGKGHPAALEAGHNAGQAQSAAEVEDGPAGAGDVILDIASQAVCAGPHQSPVRRLRGIVTQQRVAVYPVFEVFDLQQPHPSRPKEETCQQFIVV